MAVGRETGRAGNNKIEIATALCVIAHRGLFFVSDFMLLRLTFLAAFGSIVRRIPPPTSTSYGYRGALPKTLLNF